MIDLEQVMERIAELEAQLIDREKTLEAIAQVKSPDDLNEAALKRVAELESKLCGMREVLEIFASLQCLNPKPNEYGDVCGVTFTCGNCLLAKDARQVLSSTPTCKHKEEVERWKAMISGAATACIRQQLSSLQAELLEAKKWLFDDTTVASLRKELKAVREENERLQAALYEANNPDFPHPH